MTEFRSRWLLLRGSRLRILCRWRRCGIIKATKIGLMRNCIKLILSEIMVDKLLFFVGPV